MEMKHVAKKVKGWVWWGRPMWHDMGYLAVCWNLHPMRPSCSWAVTETHVIGYCANVCSDDLLGALSVSDHVVKSSEETS